MVMVFYGTTFPATIGAAVPTLSIASTQADVLQKSETHQL